MKMAKKNYHQGSEAKVARRGIFTIGISVQNPQMFETDPETFFQQSTLIMNHLKKFDCR
jgi:hypothetical protein